MKRAADDSRPASTVVLAINSERAIPFAQAFAEHGCAPMLAFSQNQLASFAVGADIVVADSDIDPSGETLRAVGDTSVTVRMFVAEHERAEADDLHAQLSPDLSPTHVVAQALALVALRGMSRDRRESLQWGPLELDPARRESRWRGERINLTVRQFDILAALVRAGGAVVTKTELQREVWPECSPDDGDRLIAHIRRIRTRIEEDPSRPQFLLTARGIGFRLAEPEQDARRKLMLIASNGTAPPTSTT